MSELTPQRRADGTFQKGSSGNVNGRPRVVGEIVELARQNSPAALATLSQIANDPKAPAAARVSAATEVMNRAYGRAPSAIDVNVLRPEPEAPDMSVYTLQELEQMRAIHDSAMARRALPGAEIP